MDVYRLMLVGVEIEYETEIFEYLGHNLPVFNSFDGANINIFF